MDLVQITTMPPNPVADVGGWEMMLAPTVEPGKYVERWDGDIDIVCQCCCLSKSGLNRKPRCLGSSSAGSMPGRVYGFNANVSDAAGGFPALSDGLFEIWLLPCTSCIVVPLYELYRMSSGRLLPGSTSCIVLTLCCGPASDLVRAVSY